MQLDHTFRDPNLWQSAGPPPPQPSQFDPTGLSTPNSGDMLGGTTRPAPPRRPSDINTISSRALTASALPTPERIEQNLVINYSGPPTRPLSAGQTASNRRRYFWEAIRSYSQAALTDVLAENPLVDTETFDGPNTALTFLAQAAPTVRRAAYHTAVMLVRTCRANVNAASLHSGRTALHWAAYFDNEDMARFLMLEDLGTDLNALDAHLQTPAMIAAERGHQALAERILRNPRADRALVDDRGRTAMDYLEAQANMPEQDVEATPGVVTTLRTGRIVRMQARISTATRHLFGRRRTNG